MKTEKIAFVALVLSILALGAAIAQPVYQLLSRPKKGMPSFDIDQKTGFYVSETFTHITLINNGTAAATNIRVELDFESPNALLPAQTITQFLPQLGPQQRADIDFPTGAVQLKAYIAPLSGLNLSSIEAWVDIQCKEQPSDQLFYFANIT